MSEAMTMKGAAARRRAVRSIYEELLRVQYPSARDAVAVDGTREDAADEALGQKKTRPWPGLKWIEGFR
jgi:hypothetical protein